MKVNRKTTLEEIAQHANCSKSVVSRAMNNKYGVREATKNKIFVAALELGYEFDHIYSHQKRKANNEYISIVLTKANLLDDKFYGQMVCGIEAVLNAHNINFCLNIVEMMNHEDLIDTLQRTKVSGVIVLGLVSYKTVAEIICNGIPVVLLDTFFNRLKVDRLTINNYSGAEEAADYFIKNNHRNIAFFGNTDYSQNFSERYRGLREFCNSFSETVSTDKSVINAPNDEKDLAADEKQMRKILMGPNRPTAVLCATDQIGFKLYKIALDCGLSLPEDLSIIGFGDSEQCKYVTPALTTIDIPKFVLGQEAANMLLKRIKDKDAPPLLVQIDSVLVVRESVTFPKSNKTVQKSLKS